MLEAIALELRESPPEAPSPPPSPARGEGIGWAHPPPPICYARCSMTARPIGTRSRADGTRETILDFLRGHDERSVDDLAGEPGLAGATVRVGGPPAGYEDG